MKTITDSLRREFISRATREFERETALDVAHYMIASMSDKIQMPMSHLQMDGEGGRGAALKKHGQYLKAMYGNDHPRHTRAADACLNFLVMTRQFLLGRANEGKSAGEIKSIPFNAKLDVQTTVEFLNHFMFVMQARLKRKTDNVDVYDLADQLWMQGIMGERDVEHKMSQSGDHPEAFLLGVLEKHHRMMDSIRENFPQDKRFDEDRKALRQASAVIEFFLPEEHYKPQPLPKPEPIKTTVLRFTPKR